MCNASLLLQVPETEVSDAETMEDENNDCTEICQGAPPMQLSELSVEALHLIRDILFIVGPALFFLKLMPLEHAPAK